MPKLKDLENEYHYWKGKEEVLLILAKTVPDSRNRNMHEHALQKMQELDGKIKRKKTGTDGTIESYMHIVVEPQIEGDKIVDIDLNYNIDDYSERHEQNYGPLPILLGSTRFMMETLKNALEKISKAKQTPNIQAETIKLKILYENLVHQGSSWGLTLVEELNKYWR